MERSGGPAGGDCRQGPAGQLELGRGLGLRDHVALDEVAAQSGEEAQAMLVFDALGHHPQAERVGELDGGAHEGEVTAVVGSRSGG